MILLTLPVSVFAKPDTFSERVRCAIAPIIFFLDTPSYCEESFEVASSGGTLTHGVPVSANVDKTTKVVSAMGVTGVNSSDIAELIDIIVNAKLKDVYKKITDNTSTHTIEYVSSGGGVSYTTLQNQSDSIVRSTDKAIDSILTGGNQDLIVRSLSLSDSFSAEDVIARGSVTANTFYGDGSHLTGVSSSQWTTDGSAISYIAGNVGIGTSTLNHNLEVQGTFASLAGNIATVDLGGNGKFLSIANGGSVGPYGPTVSLNLGFANNNDGVGTDGRGFLGTYGFSYPMQIGGSSLQFVRYDNGSSVPVISRKTNEPTLVLKAIGSQTSNLQEWRNSGGAVMNVVDASGNVGIGTLNGDGYKLAVQGPTGGPSAVFFGGSSFDARSDSGSIQIGSDASAHGMLSMSTLDGNVYLDNTTDTASNGIMFRTRTAGTPVEAMYIKGNGNVGIGTTTPGSKLTVDGDASISSSLGVGSNLGVSGTVYMTGGSSISSSGGQLVFNSGSGEIVLNSNGGMRGGWGGYLRLLNGGGSNSIMLDPTGNSYFASGNVGIGTTTPGAKLAVTGSGTGTGSAFIVANSSNSPKFTVLDNGNVGIGLINPAQALEVVGKIRVGAGSIFSFDICRACSGGPADSFGYLNFNANQSGAQGFTFGGTQGTWMMISKTGNVGIGSGNVYGDNELDYPARFHVTGENNSSSDLVRILSKASSATTTRFTITSTGNVGIGNASPSVALDVTGDIEYTGTITDVSDSRLKENITDFGSGLQILKNIGVKNYNMIGNDSTDVETGFIAQNVKDFFPEAVSIVDPVKGYMGVSYVSFIPVLTRAVQEIASIGGEFKETLIAWLGSATNGITQFFAETTHQKTLCVGEPGNETCITKSELDTLLQRVGQTSVSSPAPSGANDIVVDQGSGDTGGDVAISSPEEIIPPVVPQVEEVVPTPEPIIEAPVPETPPAPTE